MPGDKKKSSTKKKKTRRSGSGGADAALKKQFSELELEKWLEEHYRDLYKCVDRKLQRQYSSGVLWIGQQSNIGVRSRFELKDYVQSMADRNRLITQKYLNTLIFRHVSMRKYLLTEAGKLYPDLGRLLEEDESGYVYQRADTMLDHAHIPERIIDDLDRRYSLEYIGSLISKNAGYAEMRREYNKQSQLVCLTYWDAEGNPCALADGYHGITWDYDDRGNIASQTYIDEESSPTLCRAGYQREERAYDEHMHYGPIPFSEVLKFNFVQNQGW